MRKDDSEQMSHVEYPTPFWKRVRIIAEDIVFWICFIGILGIIALSQG